MTTEQLKKQLKYDKNTGEFTRKGAVVGSLDAYGYLKIKINGKSYKAHRLAWLYEKGKMPKHQIDHINHIKDDNRTCNLREVTNAENNRNRPMQCNNSSGIVGVDWVKKKKRWRARIVIGRKEIHLGTFVNIKKAREAREDAKKRYGFHPNHS